LSERKREREKERKREREKERKREKNGRKLLFQQTRSDFNTKGKGKKGKGKERSW
jgi:hypothetical protein